MADGPEGALTEFRRGRAVDMGLRGRAVGEALAAEGVRLAESTLWRQVRWLLVENIRAIQTGSCPRTWPGARSVRVETDSQSSPPACPRFRGGRRSGQRTPFVAPLFVAPAKAGAHP